MAWGTNRKRRKDFFLRMEEIIVCFYADQNNPIDCLTVTMQDREGRDAGAMSLARQEEMGLIKCRKEREWPLEHRWVIHSNRRKGRGNRHKYTKWVEWNGRAYGSFLLIATIVLVKSANESEGLRIKENA